ncbi:LaeA-like protein, partial [Eremomyces bilateralis CBS 781.70]
RWQQYHGFRRGIYLYPCDEHEKDRMDICHKLFSIARRGQLHNAPVSATSNPYSPTRIMDLGCGTGIWAIDMADKFPHAEVVGLDLVNIQPEKIPPNLRFRIPRDYEAPWTYGEESWDLIHIQMGCGSVSSWPELYQKIFAHLKPGSGWIEQVEIDFQPRCDDGTLRPESHVVQWYQYLAEATGRVSKSITYESNTGHILRSAGFIDIQETVIRAPYNGWPADPHQKHIGRWYNLSITEGLEALSLAALTRINRWDADQHVRPLLSAVRAEINSRKIHAYNNIHIWTARRPLQ